MIRAEKRLRNSTGKRATSTKGKPTAATFPQDEWKERNPTSGRWENEGTNILPGEGAKTNGKENRKQEILNQRFLKKGTQETKNIEQKPPQQGIGPTTKRSKPV